MLLPLNSNASVTGESHSTTNTRMSVGAEDGESEDRQDPKGGRAFDAAIFDMDGVITRTAEVHSRAWKRTFDEFLQVRARSHQEVLREFTHARDYLGYVDGRPREQGIVEFLKSRGIELPPGAPEDPPGAETVRGLGNRKNAIFKRILEEEGVGLFDSTVELIENMLLRGIKVGLATSSQNSAVILKRTGLASLFGSVVDGVVSARLGLKGKPEPDIFLKATGDLGVTPARAVVVEDAVSGVRAGARGGFGLVIGVARENNAHELREQGADVVVADLGETSVDEINRLVTTKRAGW